MIRQETLVKKSGLRRLGKRRPGIALVFVLTVMLIGGALISLIFQATTSYFTLTTYQRRPYQDEIEISGFIDTAKGYIVSENKRREMAALSADQVVLHGQRTDEGFTPINSASDLLINHVLLSRDVPLGLVKGQMQLLQLRTYDANYKTVKDSSKINTDPSLAGLPPSLYPWDQVNAHLSRVSDPSTLDRLVYKTYGAYVIRARLFNVDSADHPQLIKDVEVVFTQVINP